MSELREEVAEPLQRYCGSIGMFAPQMLANSAIVAAGGRALPVILLGVLDGTQVIADTPCLH